MNKRVNPIAAEEETSPADLAPQRAGIQSVEVGFSLLQVLAASRGPLMLRDVAAAAGMSAAKAHRYLSASSAWSWSYRMLAAPAMTSAPPP